MFLSKLSPIYYGVFIDGLNPDEPCNSSESSPLLVYKNLQESMGEYYNLHEIETQFHTIPSIGLIIAAKVHGFYLRAKVLDHYDDDTLKIQDVDSGVIRIGLFFNPYGVVGGMCQSKFDTFWGRDFQPPNLPQKCQILINMIDLH